MTPSSSIPEGVQTVTVEGKDLAMALNAAAENIGIERNRVEFKFDMAHFRSSTGTSVAQRTVKIIAWNTTKSDEEIAAEEEKKAAASSKRRERSDRSDRSDRGERRERRGRDRDRDRKPKKDDAVEAESAEAEDAAEAPAVDENLEETEASAFAFSWFTELISKMGIEGEVKAAGNEERVQIWVKAERAGRLIGKRGNTLGAIRHLLGLAIERQFGDLTIDVDVEDNRPDRGDRKPRERRSRDRDRGERRGRRGRGRDRDRDDRGDREQRSRYPEERLRELARRAAEKAVSEDKVITINLELNSYDRRIVHLEIAEVDGVESRSEVRDDGVKVIQVQAEK